ncbi:hypothetical protein TNCV_3963601 [Trichonephila clavipes]|nr:hypothetical protein TNCV_3963601 [Trichonephila clavipes]
MSNEKSGSSTFEMGQRVRLGDGRGERVEDRKKEKETEKEKKKSQGERGARLVWRKGLSPRLEWEDDECR